MNYDILIIDDNPRICESFQKSFDQFGYSSLFALNREKAFSCFQRFTFKVTLLDIKLGNASGIDLLEHFLAIDSNAQILMITGHATIEDAVRSIKIGALDYIQKPIIFDKLLKVVENAIRIYKLTKQNRDLKKQLNSKSLIEITKNSQINKLCEQAVKFALTDLPILIFGESGTGKELLADFIHSNSTKSEKEMIKINCSAFPETLLDNELFGHDKGAYTGADSLFKGVFERADGSSLFLDEIGEMSLPTQAKILRTIQNQEIRRLGSKETVRVNIRFITATNTDLKSLIQKNRFREDLFYRLNTAILELPPLRDRKEDIPDLSASILNQSYPEGNLDKKTISDEVLNIFYNYDWPGNVRELKNVLHYAATLTTSGTIEPTDLPPTLVSETADNENESVLKKIERELIIKTLSRNNFNKSKTAESLKMSRKTLYLKLDKYGVDVTKK